MKRDQVSIEPDPIDGDPGRCVLNIGTAKAVVTLRTQGRDGPALIFNLCGPFPLDVAPAVAEGLLELQLTGERTVYNLKKGKQDEDPTKERSDRGHGSKPANGPRAGRRGRS